MKYPHNENASQSPCGCTCGAQAADDKDTLPEEYYIQYLKEDIPPMPLHKAKGLLADGNTLIFPASDGRFRHEKGSSGADLNPDYWYSPATRWKNWNCIGPYVPLEQGLWEASFEFEIRNYPLDKVKDRWIWEQRICFEGEAGRQDGPPFKLFERVQLMEDFIRTQIQPDGSWDGKTTAQFRVYPPGPYLNCFFRWSHDGPLYWSPSSNSGRACPWPGICPSFEVPCYAKRLVLKRLSD